MKSRYLLISILFIFFNLHFVHANVSLSTRKYCENSHKKHHIKRHKSKEHIIYQKDIGKKGLVIKEPGIWRLGEDIVFNPKDNVDPLNPTVLAAITIKASNVILDLGSHRLSQYIPKNPMRQRPFVVSILIPDLAPDTPDINFRALQSIYIKGNGAIIDGFSMYGIRIFAHTYDIQISGLTIKNIAHLASKALRPFPTYLPHPAPLSPPLTNYGPSFGVGAISIGESNTFGNGPQFFVDTGNIVQNRVSSVYIENVTCLNNFFNGIWMANATDVTISNCHFDGTFSDDPGNANGPNGPYGVIICGGGAWIGANTQFEDPNIVNMVVENTTFNGTNLQGDFTTPVILPSNIYFPVVGAVITKSENITFSNCHFDDSSNTFAPGVLASARGGYTAGFLAGGTTDLTLSSCTFNGTQSLGSINAFHISGISAEGEPIKSSRNTHLLNCTASNSQQLGAMQLPSPTLVSELLNIGYLAAYAKDITFDNCITQDLMTTGATDSKGFSAGFFLAAISDQAVPNANPENIALRGCIASEVIAQNGGFACGFALTALPATSPPEPLNAAKSIIFENCIASGNKTITPTLSTPGIQQGVACGFAVLQTPLQLSPPEFRSWPTTFIKCKALHNKGLSTNPLTLLPTYSAGFYLLGAIRHSLFECEADDNIYGIFLQAATECAVRQCRADVNVDVDTGIGAGFTDLGFFGTVESPGTSTSLFEFNHAFANGSGVDHTGANGNYNVLYDSSVPVPILTGDLSSGIFPSSATYRPADNISIIE